MSEILIQSACLRAFSLCVSEKEKFQTKQREAMRDQAAVILMPIADYETNVANSTRVGYSLACR